MSNKQAGNTTAGLTEADTNGNGYYTQDEAKAYMNSKNFTKEQKAILFACMCPNAKNNPYR